MNGFHENIPPMHQLIIRKVTVSGRQRGCLIARQLTLYRWNVNKFYGIMAPGVNLKLKDRHLIKK